MPREEVRERVFAHASPLVFDYVLQILSDKKGIVARERVALAAHSVALTDDEVRARDALIDILRAGGAGAAGSVSAGSEDCGAARHGQPDRDAARPPRGAGACRRPAVPRIRTHAAQGGDSVDEAARGESRRSTSGRSRTATTSRASTRFRFSNIWTASASRGEWGTRGRSSESSKGNVPAPLLRPQQRFND